MLSLNLLHVWGFKSRNNLPFVVKIWKEYSLTIESVNVVPDRYRRNTELVL
jgi:hypothetical protein